MVSGTRTSQNPNQPACDGRRGFTLLETVAVVAIVAIVLSAVVISGRAILASQAKSAARQQLLQISNAIERYATAWPRWEIGGVLFADRGWPNPFPVRVFDPVRYDVLNDFNDAGHTEMDIEQGQSGLVRDNTNKSKDVILFRPGTWPNGGCDVIGANICLTSSLLAPSAGGPYLNHDDARAIIRRVSEVDPGSNYVTLPALLAGPAGNVPTEVLVDPWGTPYRYFWVYRDGNAHLGYRHVRTTNPNDADFRKAIGFVIESAGPDRKFGDVWDLPGSLTPNDRDAAEDNLRITP